MPELRGAPTRRVLIRYVLFQIPGWLLAAVAAWAAVAWWELSPQLAAGLFVLWLLKDFVLFPFVRVAYEPPGPSGGVWPVGARGVVVEPLTPDGLVRVGAELWRAELRSGGSLPTGAPVRVTSLRGLTLAVDREDEARPLE